MEIKKNKLILLISAISLHMVGCEKESLDKEIEVVDEYLLTGDVKSIEDEDKIEKNTIKTDDSSTTVKNDIKSNNNTYDNQKGDNKIKENNKNSEVKENDNKEVQNNNDINIISENKIDSIEEESATNLVFEKSDIPENIKAKMTGKSMPSDATISFSELSYLKISYIDFNGNTKVGEMVVNKELAQEVLDIFKELYEKKYPIQKMNLIDEYNAIDEKSMNDNNTSAFCYRLIAGTNKVSNHGKGVAIDINPFYNPHVLKSSGTVNPPGASKYVDRTLNVKAMIKKDDVVYKVFTSRGWTWGGNWNNPDYQHFEKRI